MMLENGGPLLYQLRSPGVIHVSVVGDSGVGKASLIFAYAIDTNPEPTIPSEFNDFYININIDKKLIGLKISNISDVEDIEYLRYNEYNTRNVFIVCFSIACPDSFISARDRWIPEIQDHFPGAPIVFVGMKSDLRSSIATVKHLQILGKSPVSKKKAQRTALRFGNVKYADCSVTSAQDVRAVFEKATKAVLDPPKMNETICLRPICKIM
ncbi:hypothetical protein L596_026988 [Steinernema carpocapsae]|uniref:Uncharacterized protein n=1 Tax=Steinernema carpocapsae TaxID=34508 RepID=A0A4U5M3W9_STECR|nr:hypothetical protein L596_026988 [Steinernema carpocapsae]